MNGELLLRWGRNTPNELLAHGKRVDSPCQSHRCPSRCSTPFSFSVACCSLWQAGGGAVLPLGGSQLTLFIISALSGNGFHFYKFTEKGNFIKENYKAFSISIYGFHALVLSCFPVSHSQDRKQAIMIFPRGLLWESTENGSQ